MATDTSLAHGVEVRTFPHFVHEGETVRCKVLMWIGVGDSE